MEFSELVPHVRALCWFTSAPLERVWSRVRRTATENWREDNPSTLGNCTSIANKQQLWNMQESSNKTRIKLKKYKDYNRELDYWHPSHTVKITSLVNFKPHTTPLELQWTLCNNVMSRRYFMRAEAQILTHQLLLSSTSPDTSSFRATCTHIQDQPIQFSYLKELN